MVSKLYRNHIWTRSGSSRHLGILGVGLDRRGRYRHRHCRRAGQIFPGLGDPWTIALVAILTTAIVQAVNARGVRAAGGLALVTVLIKILPLLAVIAVVLLRQGTGQPLSPLAATPVTLDNVAMAVTLTLFAMLGFEGATAPVGKVRNPTLTIPLAIIAGTSFVALLYLLAALRSA